MGKSPLKKKKKETQKLEESKSLQQQNEPDNFSENVLENPQIGEQLVAETISDENSSHNYSDDKDYLISTHDHRSSPVMLSAEKRSEYSMQVERKGQWNARVRKPSHHMKQPKSLQMAPLQVIGLSAQSSI